MRFLDVIVLYRSLGFEPADLLTRIPEGWDQVSVTNVVLATFLFGQSWFNNLESIGAFESDVLHYVDTVKKLSDTLKTKQVDIQDWSYYIECATLTGYRNPPFPGFDIASEAQNLAQGGEEHNYFGRTFSDLVERYLPMGASPAKFVSFDRYVRNAEWLTSGASSIGYLEVEYEGKTTKIKCRKNTVLDAVDLDTLIDEVMRTKQQTNKTLIKSELGKLRLAVSSDIHNYLMMAYIMHLVGPAVNQWPGSTTKEDFVAQTQRLQKILHLCSVSFGLPYDYKSFDHQPTTTEIKAIVRHLCSYARRKVPVSELLEFDDLVSRILDGFDDSILITKLAGVDSRFRVTGGLMSGLAMTSVIGNGFNSVITGLAMELLRDWGFETDTIERFIRGDDSAIFTRTWATAAAMNSAYDFIGIKAGAGKFSVRYHEMEFLRTWFSDHASGYPCRTIPGITQRKPWTSDPWDPVGVERAIYEAVRTLMRRIPSAETRLLQVWRRASQVWARHNRVDVRILSQPIEVGGFGVGPTPTAIRRVVPSVPKGTALQSILVKNQTDWRASKLKDHFLNRYDRSLPDEVAKDVSRERLLSTLSSDSVPYLAKIQRQRYRAELVEHARSMKAIALEVSFSPKSGHPLLYTGDVSAYESELRRRAPLFGRHPQVAVAREDYNILRPEMSFTQWLELYYPSVDYDLKRFHRSWHRSAALDYLEGKIPFQPMKIHPALTHVAHLELARAFLPERRLQRERLYELGRYVENEIWASSLCKELYMW